MPPGRRTVAKERISERVELVESRQEETDFFRP